jgi:hypothetical protein
MKLCQYCQKRPPVPGMKGCPECARGNKQAMRKKRQAILDGGMCQYCSKEPHAFEKKGCAGCLRVAKVKSQVQREKRHASTNNHDGRGGSAAAGQFVSRVVEATN